MASSRQFTVRFWGTRGSYPVPGPTTLRYGGNTTCVEVAVGGHTLILDAGTGIIALGNDLMKRQSAPINAVLFFTHTHHDHTQGFPYFTPAYLGGNHLYLYGPHTFDQELSAIFEQSVLPPSFPVRLDEMPSLRVMRSLKESQRVVLRLGQPEPLVFTPPYDQVSVGADDVEVRIFKSYAHPRNGVFVYRINWQGRSLVFASDTEGYIGTDRRLVAFAKQTDLLIHDAQYFADEYVRGKQGWGHSTPEMACDVARLAGAKHLILTHHEPRHHDDDVARLEAEAQGLFPDVIAAYEGLTIDLFADQ